MQQPAKQEESAPNTEAERLAAALKQRIAFEHLVADISSQLINLTSDTAGSGIEACLKRISQFTQIDRCYLFCITNRRFRPGYEWSNRPEDANVDSLPSIPVSSFPWLMAALENSGFVYIPQVAHMPAEATMEKALFTRQKASSVLILPLVSNLRLIGFMGLNANQGGKSWPAEDIALLSLLAGSFSRLLERISLAKQPGRTNTTLAHDHRQQRALSESITALLTARNPEALWQVITSATQRLLNTEKMAIYLYNMPGETLSCPIAIGFSDEDEARLRDLLPAKTWSDPHPKVINEVPTTLENGELRDLLLREKLHTYALFPLSATDAVLGALLIFRDKPHSISIADLTMGQTLAQILAIALQNIQLLAETSYALTREQQLNELTRIMNVTSDLPDILANIIRLSTEIIDADAGILSLTFDDQDMISYPYNVPKSIGLRPVPKSKGTAWYTQETSKSLRLVDYQQHPKAQPEWVDAGVSAYIAVPIVAGEFCSGALELFSLSPERRFSQRDQQLAESIGRQAGSAIYKTQLYSEAQQRVSNLTASLTRQEELDDLKDSFVQNISHELRTPLGIILGYAELLESGRTGEMQPDQQQAVGIIASRIRMLNNLVDDLTTLLAAETQDFQREPVDPILLMYSMLADFQIQAAEAGITLKSDLAADMPPIMGNITNLRRVFDNLVGNAFKATPVGGSITLRMWSEAHEVIIEVEDTGIGIPEANLERIFERFYQGNVHPTRKYEGTGLGLALVKEIIAAHRGHLLVRSQVDQGTTFQIRLPIQTSSG